MKRSMMARQEGIFVMSFDFELYWGMRDSVALDAYKDAILGARAVIPRVLHTLETHRLSATWATVGFLFCESRDELLEVCPQVRPQYKNRKLYPYDDLKGIGRDETDDPVHFAPSLIRKIAAVPRQEIATHTFSHYYCLEPGQDRNAFTADLDAAHRVAKKMNVTLRTIVFPKNQCNPGYLEACSEHGIEVYRGTEHCWFAGPSRAPIKRAARLLDSYVPLSEYGNCYDVNRLETAPAINVPASRFIRFGPPGTLRGKLLFSRISAELKHAAKHGLLYHLWCHPHNLGREQNERVAFLTAIFALVADLRSRYGMMSMTMHECGTRAVAGPPCSTVDHSDAKDASAA